MYDFLVVNKIIDVGRVKRGNQSGWGRGANERTGFPIQPMRMESGDLATYSHVLDTVTRGIL
jgi:hypothetical protein